MQEQKYNELEDRASRMEETDALRQLEARSRVRKEIKSMLASGYALTLTDEERQLLDSFRRFKLRMRKAVDMFSFQTRRPDGVQIVEETAEIIQPNEVA